MVPISWYCRLDHLGGIVGCSKAVFVHEDSRLVGVKAKVTVALVEDKISNGNQLTLDIGVSLRQQVGPGLGTVHPRHVLKARQGLEAGIDSGNHGFLGVVTEPIHVYTYAFKHSVLVAVGSLPASNDTGADLMAVVEGVGAFICPGRFEVGEEFEKAFETLLIVWCRAAKCWQFDGDVLVTVLVQSSGATGLDRNALVLRTLLEAGNVEDLDAESGHGCCSFLAKQEEATFVGPTTYHGLRFIGGNRKRAAQPNAEPKRPENTYISMYRRSLPFRPMIGQGFVFRLWGSFAKRE